jgi:hypothetical protein
MEVVQDVDKARASARVAASGGAFEELRGGPVEAASASAGGEGGEVCWPGAGGGGPETRRRDQGVPVAAAVLVEVVGQPVQRRSIVASARRAPGVVRAGVAGADAGQRPADALARGGGVGQSLLQPVLGQLVPVGVGQVPGRGCFQEGARQVGAHPHAAGIHRCVDQRRCSRLRVPVPGQQLRHPGQELDDLPILRPGGLGQARVPRIAEPLQLRGGERGRHGNVPAGQQLPRLGMRIGAARRAGGQVIPELRPERGQHLRVPRIPSTALTGRVALSGVRR